MFCWEKKKAPVITVHISWVQWKVLIRGNCLDVEVLFIKYGLRTRYVPGSARYTEGRGDMRMGTFPLLRGSHPAWFCSQGAIGDICRRF